MRKAHDDLLEQGTAPAGVREMVADSWLRSVAAGVDVDASRPPITLERDLLTEYRAEHTLARVFPLIYDVLGRAAEDCDSVMAVTDEHGQLLWVRGKSWVLRQAESIRFVEGAQWDERHAGTNAPGTALRLDAPVTIKSAEHFVRPVQRWSCAAAPVHEPGSDTILGIIDITGGPAVDSPQTIAMVRAAARMAEAELARDAALAAARDAEPRRTGTSGRQQLLPEITINGLASDEPRRVELTDPAANLLRQLTGQHGPLMFHQSGGCCDGSSPMCFPDGEFLTGDADILLGELGVPGLDRPVPFWMSVSQYEYWKHTHLTVDVVPGRGSGFSVEAPEGVRFLIRSRLLTEAEMEHFQLQ